MPLNQTPSQPSMASPNTLNSVNATGNGVALPPLKEALAMPRVSYVNAAFTSSQTSPFDGTLYLMMPMDGLRGWMPYLTSNSFSKRSVGRLRLSIRLSIRLWKLIFNSRTNPPAFYLEVSPTQRD